MRTAAPAAVTRLTYDDFLLFPDDGKRHELIDGVHYVTPAPRLRHQDLVERVHRELFLYLREHPAAGRVFLSPPDALSGRGCLRADARAPAPYQRGRVGVASLRLTFQTSPHFSHRQ